MRYTIVDRCGAVSLVGPCHVLKMLVAGCAEMPTTLDELLDHVRPLDATFADHVASGLAVFDEHHPRAGGDDAAPAPGDAHRGANGAAGRNGSVFRVTDAASRQASLQPVVAGLVVFNLNERRIVQIHNTYADIERRGRGRLRRNGRPVQTYYHYDLPAAWQLVP